MSEKMLDFARNQILTGVGLGDTDIERVMAKMLNAQVDLADIYLQSSRYESWSLEDGIIKEGAHSIEQGVGLRVVSGDKSGFACSDEISLPGLLEAAGNVRAIARSGKSAQSRLQKRAEIPALYPSIDPLKSIPESEKIALLKRVDEETRKLDHRIEQVMVSMIGAHDVILVANQDGSMHGDVRPLVRMSVSVIVEDKGRREQGSSGGGGRTDYGFFLDEERALDYGREAVRQALVNLEAVDAPAGNMTVVLGSGWPGILLHEAIGHGLEGDFNRKGTSAFSGRVGEKIASDLCTIVDDGTLSGCRGSLSVDDEG